MDTNIKKHIEGLLKQYIVKCGNIPFTHEGFEAFICERAKENKGKPPLSPGAERTQAVAEYLQNNPAQFKHDVIYAFDKRIMEILQGVDNAASDTDNVSWAIGQIAASEYMFDASDKLSIRVHTKLNPAEVLDIKSDNLNAKDNIGTVPNAPTRPPKNAIEKVGHAINAIDRKITKHMIDNQNNHIDMLKSDLGYTPNKVNNWLPVSPDGETFRQILYALRWTYSLKTQETAAENDGINLIR